MVNLVNAIGDCLGSAQRGCYPDVWGAWERIHAALGVEMNWEGRLGNKRNDGELFETRIAHTVGYASRSIGNIDQARVLADCDATFRRLRYDLLVASEDSVSRFVAQNGAWLGSGSSEYDRADDAARRAEYERQVLEIERECLVLGVRRGRG
jgi:hypothetical protein